MSEPKGYPVAFNHVISLLQSGAFHDYLSTELRKAGVELRDHFTNTRKKAKGKFKVELALAFEDGVLEIVPGLKIELPKPVLGKEVTWLDEQGNIVRDNPRQHKLPLTAVGDAGGMRGV